MISNVKTITIYILGGVCASTLYKVDPPLLFTTTSMGRCTLGYGVHLGFNKPQGASSFVSKTSIFIVLIENLLTKKKEKKKWT